MSGRERILEAVIAAIRPRGHGFDQRIDDEVLREVLASLEAVPAGVRFGLTTGLRLIEYGTPLYARRFKRFSRLTPEEGRECLEGWEHDTGLRGALFRGLRTLIFLCFYQHPEVVRSLEISWDARATALTRRRAELLRGGGTEERDAF